LQAVKTEIAKNLHGLHHLASRFRAVAMSRATATGQRDAIHAQNHSGKFPCVKAPATLASLIFIGVILS
jgi:hypothetical protein